MKKWFIPTIISVLMGFSLLTINSISPNLLFRQILYYVVGFMVFIMILKIKLNFLVKQAYIWYVINNLLLILLLIFGSAVRGTAGWIEIFYGFKIQPSQFSIITTSLLLVYLLRNKKNINLRFLAILTLIYLLPAILIILQPDLGVAMMYLISVGITFLFLPLNKKIYASFFAISIISLIVYGMFFIKPYQLKRVQDFVTAISTDTHVDYNARQALIAIGSGQVKGRGLGYGVQSHLKFLPERQTDFIFASLAEEWGFVGSAFIIIVYLSLIIFSFRLVFYYQQSAKALIPLIIGTNIAIQAGFNIGINMGLFPITGVTLPLLSFGGSSILANFIALSVMQLLIINYRPKVNLHIR